MRTLSETSVVDTDVLRRTLQRSLDAFFGQARPIRRLDRRASAFRSSFSLEELTVHFECGEQLQIVFKDNSRSSLSADARQAKPDFLYHPRREIFVYDKLLNDQFLGTAICYGSLVDSNKGRYWLFLEHVAGCELYQIGDFEVWCHVAGWLAEFHNLMSSQIGRLDANERSILLDYNSEFYWRWIKRAVALNPHPGLRAIANAYDVVVEHLLVLSRTIVHGEFYPSNILVRSSVEVPRVCPVDWETAAIGPGLVDLAALMAGKWTSEQCSALAGHYYKSLGDHNPWLDDWDGFMKSLNYCRLHLAAQWLGWSADWMPPAAHAQDWLGHAFGLATELELANCTNCTD